jgi:hypothetical protein
VVQIREDKKVKEWLSKKLIRITGNAHKVEHYDDVDNTTICKSCCKHEHGAHNCPTPENPKCGICAGDHHVNGHKCKVRSCQSTKGRRCYDHDFPQRANCKGDHTVWNKKLYKVLFCFGSSFILRHPLIPEYVAAPSPIHPDPRSLPLRASKVAPLFPRSPP